jgi:hypothetical protein
VRRPENILTGVGSIWGGYHRFAHQLVNGSGAFTVHRPDHWVFAGTALTKGEEFGGADTIVGYECDGCDLKWSDGLPYPTHSDGTPESFVALATARANWGVEFREWVTVKNRAVRFGTEDEKWTNRDGYSVMGVYERGGTVFTSGTTDWSHGLRGHDPKVIQITRNVLRRLSVPQERPP